MPNKVILITGASSGIGKSCAEYLSKKGYKVYGTSRKPITGMKTGVSSYDIIQMDVNEEVSISQCIDHIISKEGRLDVVVNNAGIGIAGSVEDTSIDDMKYQFETNYFGVLRVCQEVLPIMRKQQYGYIINIGSIAGLIGTPFQGAYSASKSAVQSLTEVLRMEVMPYGIRIVLIEPGDFKTGFTNNRVYTTNSQKNTIYTERLKKAVQTMEHDEINGCDPVKIAKLLERIINNPSPKLRYLVGPFMEKFAVQLRKFIPSKLFEKIIMDNYHI